MNELRLIRLAIALGQHGNFARAAESLNLTQPSLTRGIAALERSLGVQLFDRTRKGCVPTAFGRVLLERTLAPAARVFINKPRAVEAELLPADSLVASRKAPVTRRPRPARLRRKTF